MVLRSTSATRNGPTRISGTGVSTRVAKPRNPSPGCQHGWVALAAGARNWGADRRDRGGVDQPFERFGRPDCIATV